MFVRFVFSTFLFFIFLLYPGSTFAKETLWEIQSIDTMKYSRDASRNPIIKRVAPIHVKAVADTGANYVAIDTPYDDEFIPVLKMWVGEARKHNLKVWFRGNFSGWEGWFEYPRLKSSDEHTEKTYRFITQNPELFRDGDIFTPAPESENGILGDPRQSGRKEEFNAFLLDSFNNCQKAFSQIKKQVNCGIWSMNTDVLRETVSPETIKKMGGVISIDHYTKTPEKLIEDVKKLHTMFNAKVVLGEFGAPIPDINGQMTQEEQAEYVGKVARFLYENKDIVMGLNYWVLAGGSTSLLNSDNTTRLAVNSLTKYFKPISITGMVNNDIFQPLSNVEIKTLDGYASTKTDKLGKYELLVPDTNNEIDIQVEKAGYKKASSKVYLENREKEITNFALSPEEEGFFYKVIKFIYRRFI